ncbi:MAG TPA: class B sortase [Anaerovoracaceae bacterium]|nr:class B sortase [Anaerovoracaceae bacterium]
MTKKTRKILLGVLGLIVVLCAAFLINSYMASKNAENAVDEIKEEIVDVKPDIPIDFDAVWEINEDVIGWIKVEGTEVDYPILQHPTKDNYYMDHDIEDVQAWIPGSIYINLNNSPDFMDNNTVIYGHNMGNKTMFGTLMDFYTEDFFNEHSEIIIYTPEHIYTYEIFAAVTYNNKLIPALYDLDTKSGYQAFIDSLYETSSSRNHYTDREVTTDDKIITLSTCTIDHDHNYRFLIGAVLVNEE